MVEHAPVKRRVVGSSPTIPVAFGRMHELKPMMVTSWEHTNINFVNIYNVFVLVNTKSQAGMVEMADTSDLSSDSKEWGFKSLYQYCILNRYMNWNHNRSKSTNKNIMQGDATFDKRLPMIECQYNK